jgi:DNA polymerase-3 subunit epsilon
LADVYLELRGGRQPDLAMEAVVVVETEVIEERVREFLTPRAHAPSDEERLAHEVFLAQIKDPLWKKAS